LKISFVSFKDGILTVKVSNLGKVPGELWVDGKATGTAVKTSGNASTKLNGLKAGEHTATIHTINGDASTTFTIEVKTPSISAACTGPSEITFTVSNLNGTSEIWLDNVGTGMTVSSDGTYTYRTSAPLAEGSTHSMMVHDGVFGVNSNAASFTVPHFHTWGEWVETKAPTCAVKGEETRVCESGDATETREVELLPHKYRVAKRDERYVYFSCMVCGKTYKEENTRPLSNMYGSILLDANMEPVDYTSYVVKDDKDQLIIDAVLAGRDGKPTEIGLYMTNEFIQSLKDAGYASVKYINGAAELVINLADISDSWFNAADEIVTKIFITDPAAGEKQALVQVKAQLANGELAAGANYAVALNGAAVENDGLYTL
jgi:hypothetical protein